MLCGRYVDDTHMREALRAAEEVQAQREALSRGWRERSTIATASATVSLAIENYVIVVMGASGLPTFVRRGWHATCGVDKNKQRRARLERGGRAGRR